MKQVYFALIIICSSILKLGAQTTELGITSSQDNTIFKDLELSNGAGEYIFTGTTNVGVVKRALVQFDLSDVPAGVQVDSAMLILKPLKMKPASTKVTVFRLLTEWGEGTSRAEDGDGKGAPATAGDATWTNAIHPTNPWIKSGGDYELESSAADSVYPGMDAVFRSVKLTIDVNYWLQNPSFNFGWILIGDEVNTATSVKFGSRDHTDNLQWPLLKLYYMGTSSVHELNRPESGLKVYQAIDPQTIVIENPGEQGNARIEIFSITGTKIWDSRLELVPGTNHLLTGNMETGIYLYRTSMNGISGSGKLMITDRR